jgi:hypothetical protein
VIVVVDLLQVLEGLAYVGFIAGAIFAVIELRSMSKDRETDFQMRMNEYWSSKDFAEVLLKVRELPETTDPREIEDKVGKLGLYRYVEYLDGIAGLVENRSLNKKLVLSLAEWFGLWVKLEPWIFDVREKGYPVFASGFQWLVEEDQQWFVRMESRADRAS